MPSEVSFKELKIEALRLADMHPSDFIDDDKTVEGGSELDNIVNRAIKWVYNKKIQTFGDTYEGKQVDFTAQADTDRYALPEDFFKLLGLDIKRGVGNDRFFPVRKLNFVDRNKSVDLNSVRDVRYSLFANTIRLDPPATAGSILRIYYIPIFRPLDDDQLGFDGVNGFEDLVVVSAAIRMRLKEESDVTDLKSERDRLISDMLAAVPNRDVGEPEAMADMERYASDYPEGWDRW